MANMIDYLKWRGDLTFAEREFNEVDNLILSELAYLNFNGIVSSGMTPQLTLRDISELVVKTESAAKDVFIDPTPLLIEAASSARFSDVMISGYEDDTDADRGIQFAAMMFYLPDNTVYVAYRGTDLSIVGWREDFSFSYQTVTPGQSAARSYLDRVADSTTLPIRVGGHSKGGNLAVYAALFCRSDVRKDRIIHVYSNDGPGFVDTIAKSSNYYEMVSRIDKFVPESSIVGILLSSRETAIIIKSDAKGPIQHDPFTWLVSPSGFVRSEKRSTSGEISDYALSNWIDSLTQAQRETFVSVLFDTVEASGARTLNDLIDKKWITYNAISKAAKKLDPQIHKEVLGILLKLAASSREAIWNEAKRSFESKKELSRSFSKDKSNAEEK